MKMARRLVCGWLAMICMAIGTGAWAEVQLFEFINEYQAETSQPGLTEEEMGKLVKLDSDWKLEMEYITCAVEEMAYDGCRAYLLVHASPRDPDKTLLISDYAWDVSDTIPGTQETFEQRASREGKQIVGVGMYVNDLYGVVSGGQSYSEKHLEDGSLLLFVRYNVFEGEAGEAEHILRMREYLWEDMKKKEAEKAICLTRTAEMTAAKWSGEWEMEFGMVEELALYRSELGMFGILRGHVAETISVDRVQKLRMTWPDLVDESGEAISTLSGVLSCLEEDGTYKVEPTGGETFIYEITLPAGEEMPEKLTVRLGDAETVMELTVDSEE